jgi:hypothetical protein
MPKRVFWPLTLVIMGLIFMASNVGLLPTSFWNLWPLILVIVGLGGLLTSDKEEWDVQTPAKKTAPKSATTKKSPKRRK